MAKRDRAAIHVRLISIETEFAAVVSSAARDAVAPRSIAEISFSAPTYSPIGVRLPPKMKTFVLISNNQPSMVLNYAHVRNGKINKESIVESIWQPRGGVVV